MFDLLAIFAAIVFVVIVLQLRAMLAMPFLAQDARLVAADWAALCGAADVVAGVSSELAVLGFDAPQWLSITPRPISAANVRALASYRREADGMRVFLVPLFLAETPNRCICYLATRLVDGRTVVSQPSDPFFAITATDAEPAQLVAPAPWPELVAAHAAFVARHGVAAADACSDAVLVDLAGAWMNRRRERLLARGDLVATADGIARPGLRFALRALRAFWARPKWPANVDPIPSARLALIAQASTRIRERAPTAAMQWLLFLASNALFMLVGALVFGLQFALILLVVIAIHEAGHYFAMRAFGYRNVQMLALPLVGGVTVGHEAHPRATHRAWMSLMGPLPGILIGWVLLAVALAARDDTWLLQAASVFLAINYLNVVPVPPLDGGHIVQAMLPARWYGLRIAFLVIACLAGAAIAVGFGLLGLALIVLLQLGQAQGLLLNRRAIRQLLARGGMPADASRVRKLRVALDALEAVAGPTTRAQARIAHAEDIVRSLDVVPMSWPSRLLTGGVYSVLLAVPLLALIALLWFGDGLAPVLAAAAR
ncbi:MAG: site-2 protease family protein [Xanthomonadales bacterium]|nr:site-2 protease family protein [Xanthomonadales bacterium]